VRADRNGAVQRLSLLEHDNHGLAALCGPLEQNLRAIEAGLDVSIRRRGPIFEVSGGQRSVARATALLENLAQSPDSIRLEDLQLAMVEHRPVTRTKGQGTAGKIGKAAQTGQEETTYTAEDHDNPAWDEGLSPPDGEEEGAVLRTRRRDLRGRTPNQRQYLAQILSHDVCFGMGPAGTGKTFLAVACAVDALERDLVQRIVLTRPAVEAGERLGFLPGDLAQKVDPYLRPLYDALYDLMGYDKVIKLIEKQVIEIAPLAYMRGRTLNHAFVILDEAQNTTPEQMKMFLTRIGFGSKAVITGDPSQIDLPKAAKSGLIDAHGVLQGVRGIAFSEFSSRDVVRHPLVARIVEAYAQQSAS
jgi:phosphate starvation-inducible protein PhoH and related proteins